MIVYCCNVIQDRLITYIYRTYMNEPLKLPCLAFHSVPMWSFCALTERDASLCCPHRHAHWSSRGVISLGPQLSEQQACVGGGSGGCGLTTHPPLGRFTSVCKHSGNNSPIICVMGSLFCGSALMEPTFLASNWNKIIVQIVRAYILRCGYF